MTTIGVVGCGYWGPNLIRNFDSLGDARVKTICDMDADRLAHVGSRFPKAATTCAYDDLLDDSEIDAIVIATPVKTHHPLGAQALAAGKNLFIEKPLAASVHESRDLVQLAEAKGLTLMVGHTFLYASTVRKIKEILDDGLAGEVLYISSRRLNLGLFQKGVNVTWDLAPHDLSLVLYFLGKEPVSVNCQGKAHYDPEVEDVSNLSLSFGNGSFAMVHSSWIDPRKVRETVIVGTDKMIIYDDTEPIEKLRIYDKRVEAPPHYDTFAEFHYSYHYGDMHVPHINHVEPLKTECQHFVDCIGSGQRPLTDGVAGLQVVQILEAAEVSMQNNGEQVPIDQTVAARGMKLISADVHLGENVRIYDFVNLYGCEIGDNTKVGTFVEVQKGVRIGRNCKISSHSFICTGVTLEDAVFVGHGVTFTNDRFPRATTKDGELRTEQDWHCETTLVKSGASIGSGATILCGLVIGERAVIGAGSVVTKDVPALTVVAGNPALPIKALKTSKGETSI